jgi:ABC-2 type transport system ATP-binding protein
MILTEDLGKRFDEFQAVDSVNLNIRSGEVLALLGPNGAGKTTTVRMLASVLAPTSGRAIVAGFDVVRQPAEVRARVGVLTENHGLYDRMPAGEYLDFFGQIYRLKPQQRTQEIQRLMGHFGLGDRLNQRIGEFSKGMRQKLSLARALLHNPPVLLLDEPTSAMDPESSRLVRDAILTLRSEDRTIVICTHNLAEAEELADKIAIIRHGKIIAQGTSASLKAEMLGPAEFEIRLAIQLNGHSLGLPAFVERTASGPNWIRFRTQDPDRNNPLVLKALIEQDLPVVSLQAVPHSLEEVYLQAIQSHLQEAQIAG